MIISRTPLRISFAGGGSDISNFYHNSQGEVISTAINKYVYIAVNNQFDGRIIINYSKTETVKKVDDIENNLVREAMRITGVRKGIYISSIADIPSEGTGLGSSSAYVVGLLNALYAYQGKHVNAERLASEACKIEIDILKKPVGKQDQYIAAYGGFQHIRFNSDESVYVDPVICLSEIKKKLEKNILLLYTGITRSADSILAKQIKNLTGKKNKRTVVSKMVSIVRSLDQDLKKNKINQFGKHLHENWLLKQKLADDISSKKIDRWYRIAKKHGAEGGKILGAGGGGFLLIYADASRHKKITGALSELKPFTVKFEPQGSKIIFVSE